MVDVVVSLTHLRHHCRQPFLYSRSTRDHLTPVGTTLRSCGFSQSAASVDMHKRASRHELIEQIHHLDFQECLCQEHDRRLHRRSAKTQEPVFPSPTPTQQGNNRKFGSSSSLRHFLCGRTDWPLMSSGTPCLWHGSHIRAMPFHQTRRPRRFSGTHQPRRSLRTQLTNEISRKCATDGDRKSEILEHRPIGSNMMPSTGLRAV